MQFFGFLHKSLGWFNITLIQEKLNFLVNLYRYSLTINPSATTSPTQNKPPDKK